jgi:hypothetical protein
MFEGNQVFWAEVGEKQMAIKVKPIKTKDGTIM